MKKNIAIYVFALYHALALSRDYPKLVEGYYSQKGQDKYLNEVIFKGKKNGFFIEVGAHDGISFSNTYFFEKYLDWTGICVEPNPTIFKVLQKNRSCICEEICISDGDGKKKFLLCSGYMLEMYSGLLDNIDPRHLDRIQQESIIFGGNKTVISVNCCTLQQLVEKYNVNHIDLLSIDIEGGEEAALKSIDFEKITIDVMVIENNFNETRIKNYLKTKGYLRIQRIGKDDVYIKGKQ